MDIIKSIWDNASLIFLKGFIPTIQLILTAISISFIIGAIGGTIRTLKVPILDQLLGAYIGLMRGTPFLVLLLIVYFVVFPIDAPYLAALVALVLCHGGYSIEIFRGSIEAIQEGQTEAAKSAGMSFYQSMRFIIVQQALLSALPALIGQYILLIKDTALASVIGYVELTRTGRNLMQVNLTETVQILTIVGFYYFILCHYLKQLADIIENNVKDRIVGQE